MLARMRLVWPRFLDVWWMVLTERGKSWSTPYIHVSVCDSFSIRVRLYFIYSRTQLNQTHLMWIEVAVVAARFPRRFKSNFHSLFPFAFMILSRIVPQIYPTTKQYLMKNVCVEHCISFSLQSNKETLMSLFFMPSFSNQTLDMWCDDMFV